MKEVERIVDQLNRAFGGDAWHGPSITELLTHVTSEQAAARPIPNAHSIWEIVLHIIAWKDVVRRRLAGESVELTAEEDWPQVHDTSEAAWKTTLKELLDTQQKLLQTPSQFHDAQLENIVPGLDYKFYVMLHGLIQHDLYHAGQIALLKKNQS